MPTFCEPSIIRPEKAYFQTRTADITIPELPDCQFRRQEVVFPVYMREPLKAQLARCRGGPDIESQLQRRVGGVSRMVDCCESIALQSWQETREHTILKKSSTFVTAEQGLRPSCAGCGCG